jgi:hypothetical protein
LYSRRGDAAVHAERGPEARLTAFRPPAQAPFLQVFERPGLGREIGAEIRVRDVDEFLGPFAHRLAAQAGHAVLGATLFILVENYLQDVMKFASEGLVKVPLLRDLVNPDRWLLWLGLLFVLSVYRFPTGIVGKLRAKARRA